MPQGNQKHDNHRTKIRFPRKKYIIIAWYGSLYSYLSHFITPDVDSSYLLRHAQFSGACCLKKKAASAVGSSKKKKKKKYSVGNEKSHRKHIQFLFWFIALCNYSNQRALLRRADIQKRADLFSCHNVEVCWSDCVRAVFVRDCTYKCFIVQKWTCLEKKIECWCLQGGNAAGSASEPKMCLWVTFSMKRTDGDLIPVWCNSEQTIKQTVLIRQQQGQIQRSSLGHKANGPCKHVASPCRKVTATWTLDSSVVHLRVS